MDIGDKRFDRVVLEVSDEDYKQNTIYRPWNDILASETTGPGEARQDQAGQGLQAINAIG